MGRGQVFSFAHETNREKHHHEQRRVEAKSIIGDGERETQMTTLSIIDDERICTLESCDSNGIITDPDADYCPACQAEHDRVQANYGALYSGSQRITQDDIDALSDPTEYSKRQILIERMEAQ